MNIIDYMFSEAKENHPLRKKGDKQTPLITIRAVDMHNMAYLKDGKLCQQMLINIIKSALKRVEEINHLTVEEINHLKESNDTEAI